MNVIFGMDEIRRMVIVCERGFAVRFQIHGVRLFD